MDNSQVAHLWANRSRERAKGSNFYFEGDTIYSYGSHFPIARHFGGVVLFTNQSYSVSTSRHISYVRQACTHLRRFTVSNPLDDPSAKDVREYREQLKRTAEKAARARNPEFLTQCLERETAPARYAMPRRRWRIAKRAGRKTL